MGVTVLGIQHRVALRKESVDRNNTVLASFRARTTSLSARRAWIEICCSCRSCWLLAVALRKESVDRNVDPDGDTLTDDVSLSARRAWIEIYCSGYFRFSRLSLSARRAWIEIRLWACPDGSGCLSLSARRAWIEIPKIL